MKCISQKDVGFFFSNDNLVNIKIYTNMFKISIFDILLEYKLILQ